MNKYLKNKYLFALLLLTLFFPLMLFNCKMKKTYCIGVLTNLEGTNSELNITAYNAIKLAYNEFKEKDHSLSIEFTAVDESFEPEKIKISYERLIKNNCDVYVDSLPCILSIIWIFFPLLFTKNLSNNFLSQCMFNFGI